MSALPDALRSLRSCLCCSGELLKSIIEHGCRTFDDPRRDLIDVSVAPTLDRCASHPLIESTQSRPALDLEIHPVALVPVQGRAGSVGEVGPENQRHLVFSA